MHGPKKQAGGVAALEGIRTPSRVALAVSQQTDHHLLVGKGAQDFARGLGFKVEDDLNTEKSREMWLEWKRRIDSEHYLNPKSRIEVEEKVRRDMALSVHPPWKCEADELQLSGSLASIGPATKHH